VSKAKQSAFLEPQDLHGATSHYHRMATQAWTMPPSLDPLGRKIIECFLNNSSVTAFESRIVTPSRR
jgi:hypothetical protein